jgi:hypothetical protein
MMEVKGIDQYLRRLAECIDGPDLVVMLRVTARTLERLVKDEPEVNLRSRPEPQKWSAIEIVAHQAEEELVTSWRYRLMIERSGTTIASLDRNKWAGLGDYGSWEMRAALKMFRLLRETNLRLLARLTPREWQCEGVHAELGRLTVRDLACHRAAKDIHNMLQIEQNLSAACETENDASAACYSVLSGSRQVQEPQENWR